MSEDAMTTTPEAKAASAAEELAAEGLSVTAAAVRERAGVRMATAAAAARAWKEREKKVEDESVEPVPEQVKARILAAFEVTWREARSLSRAEFDKARADFEAQVLASEGEVAKLTAAVEELEQECERIDTEAKGAAKLAAENAAAHESRLAKERSRADRAEGALGAVTGERDRLLAQLAAMRSATDD